ncbi:glycosyltransferase involved in cell wall biosynthesis [Pseudoxanthomonas japonensis]|uniref:glycosyltransferase n=1 Tax=Pseudoxanthomonas japonensis TaxID=69284 RepID=UPI00285EBE5C|nr:glycosyltransferase [Pseudoxanthomonas japonensis]MDR7067980.1 glycosyltransferase involved in cell wall biosynthesis [Pseudoxanthomonas japonensis]
MRIALDLQACQTASRHRGIGRYSLDLTRALLSRGNGELLLGLDGTYPTEADEVAGALRDVATDAAFNRYYYPGPVHSHGHPDDIYRPAADVLVQSHYRRLAPDVVHVHSLFEGFVDHASGVPGVASLGGPISSVTLYDFIPLVYADKYLVNPEYKAWYTKRLTMLQRFDLMLCISEATRADAIRFLGIPADRLAVIHAGVGTEFVPKAWAPDARSALLRSLGIRDRFVLYTGNGDFRKNLVGAIEAFARLPQDVRLGLQLVLNQVDDEVALRTHSARHGLAPDDIVITGKVSNSDLIALFQMCEVFFFPSLYEGFGLPVLEAMACGAPTICGDNSSLREVMQREDAMFDAASPEAAAGLLAHVLMDEGFRTSLRESGLARAAEYSWERSARLANGAWQEAYAHARTNTRHAIARPPRKRIAMVTPLLPERTGVASYVSEILAPLSRYLDVDLYTSADPSDAREGTGALPVLPCSELSERAANYDSIVYQFGNSPFHSHMVDLLTRYPGVVVLHDVYLSSMFWYMGEHGGVPGVFEDALMRTHGRSAVACLRDDGPLEARRRYPASLGVLEAATAVIVHSEHSRETIRTHYPYARTGRIHVAPMPVRSAGPPLSDERKAARARLGIRSDECLVVSLGFVADTKLSTVVLQALAGLRGVRTVKMAFVGENDGGPYGREMERLIEALGRELPTVITGFVDETTYRDYLLAADVAVQLRSGSRGETSKAVYDCMSRGVATVVNDYGSLGEVPDDCVVRLPAVPGVKDLEAALSHLTADADARRALGDAAVEFMRRKHAPDATARVYAEALRGGITFGYARDAHDLVDGLTQVLECHTVLESESAALEFAIARERRDAGTPRVLLDLSEVVHVDYATGVHRVVRNLGRETLLLEAPTWLRVDAVVHDRAGVLTSAESYVTTALGVPGRPHDPAVRFRANDVLFLLDSAWEVPERFDASLAGLELAGGRAAAFVHDLIPLRHPEFCIDYMPAVFEKWLRYVVRKCDVLVCNSDATAADLRAWIYEVQAPRKSAQRIGYVHLGCDLAEPASAEPEASHDVRQVFQGWTALVVGTLEPRKGCADVLDAFEARWRDGSEQKLVFFGKKGWNVEAFVERLESHPELGRRLFWFQGLSDAELNYAYQHASVLVQASLAEGFGLPIIEASRHHLPLLLSDLPVFREIAASHAAYFRAGDAVALAGLLGRPLPAPPPEDLGLTWKQSAQKLLRLLMGSEPAPSC